MWDIDEPGRNTSSAGRARTRRRRWRSSSAASSRVWVTPFAGPVLPEVKKIAAGSAGSSAGGSNAAAARSRRAARRCAAAPRRARPRIGEMTFRGPALRRARWPPGPRRARRGRAAIEAPLTPSAWSISRRGVAVVQRRHHQPRLEAGQVVDDAGRSGSASARRPARPPRGRARGRRRRAAPLGVVQLPPRHPVERRHQPRSHRDRLEPGAEQVPERRRGASSGSPWISIGGIVRGRRAQVGLCRHPEVGLGLAERS